MTIHGKDLMPSEEIQGCPHLICPSLSAAMTALSTLDTIESIFVVGGERVYKEAMLSSLCKKLYITEILKEFVSDAFYPEIDPKVYSLLQEHDDPLIPGGIVEENGIKYRFTVYQRSS